MQNKLSLSEREVISAMKGIKPLPVKGKLGRYKRHLAAIESLKFKKVIFKDSENILQFLKREKKTY